MNYWIGVASKDHVLIGKNNGIIQLCHGKESPLKRIKKGDFIIYYSPKLIFSEKTPYKKFTAIAEIIDNNIYQFKMSKNFIPFRRNVKFFNTEDADIIPLINDLSFIKDKKNWGINFRYGLFKINAENFKIISNKMNLNL